MSTLTVPLLLYVGDGCSHYANAKRCAEAMPNVTFVVIPGLNHMEGFVRIDLALPPVKRFLAEVSGN